MTKAEQLNHLAVRVSQIKAELKAFAMTVSLPASHEAGVIQSYCNSLIDRLMKLAGRPEMNDDVNYKRSI